MADRLQSVPADRRPCEKSPQLRRQEEQSAKKDRTTQVGNDGMKDKLKSVEVWFKIVLLFVFSGFLILAIPYPRESKQFPQLLAAISLVLTLAALAVDFLRVQVLAGEIDLPEMDSKER